MIECVVTSSVLILVVTAVRFLFQGKISRRLQYALWGLVLLRLLLPFPLFKSSLSVMNALGPSEITSLVSGRPAASDAIGNTGTPADEAGATARSVQNEKQGSPAESGNSSLKTDFLNGSSGRLLGIVWLIGGTAVGLWFAGVNIAFYIRLRKTRQVLPTDRFRLRVYTADSLASPCLFGLLHPAVYLTAKAAESEGSTRHVLTHELCHYRHGDHIWSVLRVLYLSLWWWNPLVWAAALLSREDSELACDEAAIRLLGEENRLAYGHTLVDMIAIKKAPTGLMFAATTMVSGKQGFKERLNMIIKNPKTFIPALVAALLIVAVSVGGTFTGAKEAGLSPQEALEKLAASVLNSDGQVSFQIPGGYEKAGEWNLHISGRLASEDFSQSIHLMEDVNDSRAWKPGERYFIPLNEGYTHLELTAFLPDENGEFLEKSVNLLVREAVPVSPVLKDSLTTGNPSEEGIDRADLDTCVSDAILTANIASTRTGEFAAEAHTVLKTVENGGTTTVYAMALYLEFSYEGSGISETGGSHMPVAITFEKNAAGEYELKEYWTPQDGSYYAPSIREKFPADVQNDAIDTQKYIMAHTQSCYEKAIRHGNVNLDDEIALLIETIVSSPAHMSDPGAYIKAHYVEYRQLLYYGKYTLRYCFALFEQGGQGGLESHIMALACQDILGAEEHIGLTAKTGQKWYDAFKEAAVNMRRQNGDDFMEKNMPGSWLLLQMLDAAGN